MQMPKDTLILTTDGQLPEAKSRFLHLEIWVLTPPLLAVTGLWRDSARKHA